MGEPYYRSTWVEVDLQAIADNVRAFRAHLPQQTKIMAVIKADGYGHGAIPVAKAALASGAEYLGVAMLEEAIELRQAGITAPILALGYIPSEFVAIAIQHDVTMTVYHEELIPAIQTAAEKLNKNAKVHLKVDTGMGRIGVRTKEEFSQLAVAICQSPRIELEGAFTHFACADEEDSSYTGQQLQHFTKILESSEIPLIHCSNSAAAILFPNQGYNMIRLGISLYGQYPSTYTKGKGVQLKPAFSLKAKVTHVKQVPAGTFISYGATYQVKESAYVATIPIGYADGYSRSLSNRGSVLIRGKRVPIIGRVCMDQLMVDVSSVPDCRLGDEVVLIGKQGNQEITVDEVADLLHTINYEVTCMISKRVPRIYGNAQ
ncbi:alanine racemase [Ammoniphilus resinae]|uniref:Alanine racemase n=1 Tax=Ammoniphilus resinae TaxID=861532 RepID=A0ABS4GII6_9BACL|nr:alanine racemase [Ammoniphilus resinae]MBP1930034.1 alanine racemase [Ammoniphilus resinae]